MSFTRREFLMGCSAAIAAMAAGRVGQLVFADPAVAAPGDEILVVVFLRGGCDGLSLLSPYDDPIYRQARGSLALPTSGANAALRIEPANATYNTSSFGLNARMAQLRELYSGGDLAFVHACGLDDDTRSHFDAMDYIERGTPGNKSTGSGWITRHLQTTSQLAGYTPVLAAQSSAPAALLGYSNAVATSSPRDFDLNTHWRYNRDQEGNMMLQALGSFYPSGAPSLLDKAGRRTLETIQAIKASGMGNYTPRPGVTYPDNSFARALRSVAQLAKSGEMGLRIATVDYGGWDTHERQSNSDGTGYMPDRLGALSEGLYAFYSDMFDFRDRLTVLVMSEFGRRLGRNASDGTDHGHGNVMMLLGGGVRGGKIYGSWPGLADLDQDQDLRITTDFRVVLTEVLTKRLGNLNIGTIFPGLTQTQYGGGLGLVDGSAGAINWGSQLNGLEPRQGTPGQHKIYLPVLEKC